ncbi:MAG: UDP-N-acetylmuramoyl-tripeptide--D-alanyl-D-alanine ligase [Fimbriimonadales bacterium]
MTPSASRHHSNGVLFRLSQAAYVMGGTLVGRDEGVTSVVADSRQASDGSLFFAIPGARVDGHDFIRDAFRRGAVCAVVNRGRALPETTHIAVDNTVTALGDLAAWHRSRMPAKVIGITGSTGKTSVKELTVAALSVHAKVHKTEGNLNTEIGVPLALFDLMPWHHLSVVEMGMRGLGQIAELCRIASPTVGVVTSVGLVHVAEVGSPEAVAQAKGELVEALPSDGAAILRVGDRWTNALRARATCRVITFGPGGDVQVVHIEPAETHMEVSFTAFGRRVVGQIYALGRFQAENAAAALAVAGALNLDVERAAAGLRNAAFPPQRMQTLRFGKVRVLADMYNANPDSMAAALRTLAEMPAKRRVAVLGSMLELGEFAEQEHRSIGRLVAELGVNELGVVGTEAGWIADAALEASMPKEGVTRLETTEAAAEWLPGFVQDEDLILIKGSRALRMERLLDALAEARS